MPDNNPVRLDLWLWAARFFKTRSLAAAAVDGGKVDVNGDHAKRSRAVKPGDEIRVRNGPYEHIVIVKGLSARRGPASEAQLLYEETAASKAAREQRSLQMKSFDFGFHEDGKPTRQQRKDLRKFRGKE